MDSKRLKIEFTGRGSQRHFEFTQIERRGDFAIYSKSDGTFEVIKIRKHKKDKIIKGHIVSPAGKEYYPSCSDWGVSGWTYCELDKAYARMNSLVS